MSDYDTVRAALADAQLLAPKPLSNKETRRLDVLKERCSVLRARVECGAKTFYITEWQRELTALEWAIQRIENQSQPQLGDHLSELTDGGRSPAALERQEDGS